MGHGHQLPLLRRRTPCGGHCPKHATLRSNNVPRERRNHMARGNASADRRRGMGKRLRGCPHTGLRNGRRLPVAFPLRAHTTGRYLHGQCSGVHIPRTVRPKRKNVHGGRSVRDPRGVHPEPPLHVHRHSLRRSPYVHDDLLRRGILYEGGVPVGVHTGPAADTRTLLVPRMDRVQTRDANMRPSAATGRGRKCVLSGGQGLSRLLAQATI